MQCGINGIKLIQIIIMFRINTLNAITVFMNPLNILVPKLFCYGFNA